MNHKTTSHDARTGTRVSILTDTTGFMRVTLETCSAHGCSDTTVCTVPRSGPFNVCGLDLGAVRDLLRAE